MATTVDFIAYICERIRDAGFIQYKKMFGEYMVYVNEKPVLLVCDNIVYVKKHDCIAEQMQSADTASPYTGAKEYYILDIDDIDKTIEVIRLVEPVTPMPKPRKKKQII